jgi:hypothetical protein
MLNKDIIENKFALTWKEINEKSKNSSNFSTNFSNSMQIISKKNEKKIEKKISPNIKQLYILDLSH